MSTANRSKSLKNCLNRSETSCALPLPINKIINFNSRRGQSTIARRNQKLLKLVTVTNSSISIFDHAKLKNNVRSKSLEITFESFETLPRDN